MSVRVRFSPAPTGSLHVGCGAHRAVQLALRAPPRRHVHPAHRGHRPRPLARRVGRRASRTRCAGSASTGTRARSSRAPRFEEYRAAADQLLGAGLAYECYCTEEEVKARSDAARAAGRPPGYDGHCRDLTADERAAAGRPRVGRHRSGSAPPTTGVSEFIDLVRGEVQVEWSTIADFVIVRSDGNPIFFLANAVDDIEMGITHVIRGEDLLDSTHRVLGAAGGARRDANGRQYAHLPLIVGPDRAKLSKRHGAVAIEDFRDRGLPARGGVQLPRAARLGARRRPRGDGPRRDRATLRPRPGHARGGGVRPQEARLDERRVDPPAHAPTSWRRARCRSPARGSATASTSTCLGGALRIGQERAVTLGGLVDQTDFLFVDDAEFRIDGRIVGRSSSAPSGSTRSSTS